MKKRIFETGIAGIVFLLATSFLWALPPDEVLKRYHQAYPANQKTQLNIQNKYGDVNLENWETDSVAIDVVITVEYPDREKAERLLKYLNVSFSASGNQITAITEISSDFSRFSRHFWSNEKKFSIDYTIHAPAYINYNLLNKYGDAFINELNGKADIEIMYGHLKVNRLGRGNTKPLNNITMAYSKGSIDKANWLMLDLRYSRLEINDARALAGETKYSKLYTGDISSVVLESKYDTYAFGKLVNLIIEGAYDNIKADEISKKIVLDTRYTGVNIDHIPSGFNSIEVDNEYGGIHLDIESGASYHLTGNTSYCSIRYPESSRVSRIVRNNSYTVQGLVGKDANTKSTVKIKSRYGTVTLY